MTDQEICDAVNNGVDIHFSATVRSCVHQCQPSEVRRLGYRYDGHDRSDQWCVCGVCQKLTKVTVDVGGGSVFASAPGSAAFPGDEADRVRPFADAALRGDRVDEAAVVAAAEGR